MKSPLLQVRRLCTLLSSAKSELNSRNSIESSRPITDHKRRTILLPYRTLIPAKGQDLDFINVVHSHLINSEWDRLEKFASGLTPFRIKHVLLKVRKDYVLSLEFFKWVEAKNSDLVSLDVHSIVLHTLTKNRKFKSAESILKKFLQKGSSDFDFASKVFDSLVHSYRMCESSPRVFDALFTTYARTNKFRNATDCFRWMKEYDFYPTLRSCNMYLSSLSSKNRWDIALAFYKEMCRCKISPDVYTLNMIVGAYCKVGKFEAAMELFRDMNGMGFAHNTASYNTLIAGYCSKDLLDAGLKLKKAMENNGVKPNNVTYNTLINAFCKKGKLNEASELFREMKSMDVGPTIVTYNTLIDGCFEGGKSEMGMHLFEEMGVKGVKADIMTYNAVIKGLCKQGKTKKAAYVVKELDEKNLVPNAQTFAALITGHCKRKKPERALQIYKVMVQSGFHPNEATFEVLLSSFIEVEDYDEGASVLREMIGRVMVPSKGIITQLCNGLCRGGNEKLAMELCDELESKCLMPKDFERIVKSSADGIYV